MRQPSGDEIRIFAVSFSTQGIGFAVTEGATDLLDWGFVAERGKKNERNVTEKVLDKVSFYQPTIIVVEDLRRQRRRSSKSKAAMNTIRKRAQKLGTPVELCKPREARSTLSSLGHTISNRGDMARALVRYYPQLENSLPPRRKAWMSEDSRMQIFIALSLTIRALEEMR